MRGNANLESILNSVKKMLGLDAEYDAFDTEIIIHINSVFMILQQLGVGPETGFAISDDTAVWTDFIEDDVYLALVKSYMYLKVRMLFDPPQNSALLEAMNSQIAEFEWRLNVNAESTRE